jgi:hypothetical protein
MLQAGLDLSRKELNVCLLSGQGEHIDQLAVAPDVDSLRRLARRIEEVHAEPVCAVVESMTGARLVYDALEQEGWDEPPVRREARERCTSRLDQKVGDRIGDRLASGVFVVGEPGRGVDLEAVPVAVGCAAQVDTGER